MEKGTYRAGQEQLELGVSLDRAATQTARLLVILTGSSVDNVKEGEFIPEAEAFEPCHTTEAVRYLLEKRPYFNQFNRKIN